MIAKLADKLQQNEISRQNLFKGMGKHLSTLEASSFLKTNLESAYKKIVDLNRELPEHRQRINRIVSDTARHNEISKLHKESKEELKTLEKESSTICRDIGEAAYLSFKKTRDPGEYYLELFSDLAAHDQAIKKIEDELDQQHHNMRNRPILKKLVDKGRAALLSSSKSAKMMAFPGLYRKAGQKLCESEPGEEAADKRFATFMAPYLKNRQQAGKIESRNQELLAEQERLWQELKALGAEKRHQKLVKELEKTTRHIEEELEQFQAELGKLYCKEHPSSVVSDDYIEESRKKLEGLDKEKHMKLRRAIVRLRRKLRVPLAEIEEIEQELEELYLKERKLREKSKIDKGTRRLGAGDAKQLKEYEKQISRCLRSQKAVQKDHKEDFARLQKDTKEAERIRLKDKVYRIDTELDQLMTCFKLSFANLCSLLLSECMNNERYEMLTLFESIFQLNGDSMLAQTEKLIELERNPKEHKVMEAVEECMKRLNKMGIRDLQGRSVRFAMENG